MDIRRAWPALAAAVLASTVTVAHASSYPWSFAAPHVRHGHGETHRWIRSSEPGSSALRGERHVVPGVAASSTKGRSAGASGTGRA